MILSIIIAVVSTIYSYTQSRKAKKRAEREAEKRKGFELNTKGEARALPIVYGRSKVGATLADVTVRGSYTHTSSTGSDGTAWVYGLSQSKSPKKNKNEFLVANYAICQGGINSVNFLEVDDVDYNNSEFQKDGKGGHRIVTHTEGGVADPMTSTNGLRSDSKFTDCAFAGAVFYLNRDDPQYYQIPDLTFYVEGLKVASVTESNGVYSYNRSNKTIL